MTVDVLSEAEHLGLPPSAERALAGLAEPLRRWFAGRHGTPTPAQRLGWPALAAGKHLLLAAPTGSGKTLAAFVPILQDLLTGPLTAGVRCLYVAPLKALLTDVRKALRGTCHGLGAFLPGGNYLRVAVRTGDTPARSRRHLRQQPADILLTTPESLAVLLSQPSAEGLFRGLRWVVVDEVHALAANKRGADLAVSLERLAAVAGGEPQRVGLSATCGPLEEAARFLVGTGRGCAIAHVADAAPLELVVEPLPVPASAVAPGGGFLNALVERLEPELRANRSVLVFANTRSLAERLAWALRRRCPDLDAQIAVHHSALAAVRRRRVEQRLKRGRLRAVISSTSLELGIDIGSVDLVVLVHPPGGVVRLLQRVGRSGHAPAGARRGLVLTASAAELLEAAVTAASGRSAQCEPLRVPAGGLDVLCQQLLGLAAFRPWCRDEAFDLVRRSYPYRDLDRRDFDDCLAYLSGRPAAAGDGDWLPARLRWDGEEFRLCDARTARLVRRNLGTILAEEPLPVLLERTALPAVAASVPLAGSGEKPASGTLAATDGDALPPSPLPVGHVDEAFADGLQPGTRFLLDGRCLEFRRRDGGVLLVQEVPGRPSVPRWAGDGLPLSAELARRLYLLRLQARDALLHGPAALRELLDRDYALPAAAADGLVAYFQCQECVSEVPDAATCLVEAVHTEAGSAYHVHTPLNRAGNDALARVAVLRLARDHGLSATSLVADLGFAVAVRAGTELAPDALRGLLAADGFTADLDAALARSETLRERFRRSALVGLMLLRNPLGPRRRVGGPDWAERRLFEQVQAADPDFVLLRQAWREVRAEACDAAAARRFLEDLPRLRLCCRRLAQPSPFVESWTQLAAGPVESVESPDEALRRLHANLTGGGPGGT